MEKIEVDKSNESLYSLGIVTFQVILTSFLSLPLPLSLLPLPLPFPHSSLLPLSLPPYPFPLSAPLFPIPPLTLSPFPSYSSLPRPSLLSPSLSYSPLSLFFYFSFAIVSDES